MSYLDAYIPKCPSYGWQGGPEFSTLIVQMKNGRERRNAEIAFARHSFTVPFNNISPDDYAGIKQMHLVCRGQLHNFKFKDQLDYQAENEVFGQGDGATRVFQLQKTSTISGVSYNRQTYVIRDGATILVNGSAATHTIDQDRGLVTFASAPANLATIKGTWEFDLWVRFNQDNLPFSIDNIGVRTGSVGLIEVPPPPAS